MESKEGYVAAAKERLGKEIKARLAEIRELVAGERPEMEKAGGAAAVESILVAVDCTADQVGEALEAWTAPKEAEA